MKKSKPPTSDDVLNEAFSVVGYGEPRQELMDDSDDEGFFLPAHVNKWDPRLILDLALDLDGLPTILDRYGLSRETYESLSKVPTFRRELAMVMRDIHENGVSFLRKAKVQSETYLDVIDAMINNVNTPANIRLAAIQSMVEWAGLKPKEQKQGDAAPGSAINIQINF